MQEDSESQALVARLRDESTRVLAVYCLRLLIAPLVETMIILDRVAFLREHGNSAVFLPLFDPVVSPRNIAVIAWKRK